MIVGVLGGGQLGRMLALAGYPLGLRFRALDPSPEAPTGHLGQAQIGAYDDPDALATFADGLSVATYEFENVPDVAARGCSKRRCRSSRRRWPSRRPRIGSPRSAASSGWRSHCQATRRSTACPTWKPPPRASGYRRS